MPTAIRTHSRDEMPGSAAQPEVALIVSTYQKPRHLRLSLTSIALQHRVAGKFEVIVADDGSTDETASLVEQFAHHADFPVKFTTHPHEAFQVARARNEGTAAGVARYLVFVDGDCILPPDFVLQHLICRRPGVVMFGDCYRLEEQVSARIDESVIRSGAYRYLATRQERRRLARQDRKARWYNFVRHPSKPRLLGGNFGLWRADYERVNGCDENFEGWGCEDDDLGFRLRQAGLQLKSILRWTCIYHVWHRRDATATAKWEDGANVPYLRRRDRPTRCRNGLVKVADDESSQSHPSITPTIESQTIPFAGHSLEDTRATRNKMAA